MRLNVNKAAADPAVKAKSAIAEHLNTNGTSFVSKSATDGIASLESLSIDAQENVQTAFADVAEAVKEQLQQAGIEQIDDTQLTAASIAAMAAGNPVGYARQALSGVPGEVAGGRMIHAAGADYRDAVNPSLEAFDERALRDSLPTSIVFNYLAARQGPFAEMFYPTTVVTPDLAAVDMTVNRLLVFNEVRHHSTGNAVDFKKVNLVDAAVDPEILRDQSTRLVPYLNPDNSNAASFAPAAVVGSTTETVAGHAVRTAPLAMGRDIGLIGVSHYAPLVTAQVLDHTDSVDARASIDNLYLQAEAGAYGIKFPTAKLPRSTFIKSIEGNYREMNLHFPATDLVLDGATRGVDGQPVAALAALAANSWSARISVMVNGVLNVETGNVKVYASPVTVVAITETATGREVALSVAAAAELKAAIEAMSFVGYDLGVNRTNSNRRTRGLMLDVTWETERYTIPLGAPLSVPAPITSNREGADLKALVAAARTRNDNNAVTALFDYSEVLESYMRNPRMEGNVPLVPGMGRYYVQVWFERRKLNLVEAVNSIRSGDKFQDIQGALVSVLRDQSYRMYRDSRIQPALDALNSTGNEKPKLLVGTDQVLIGYLQIPGDTRTFGKVFENFQIECSFDKRVKNTIVLAMGREKVDGPDALHFGTHAWIPELTSTVQITRNGALTKETMVQPRSLHFNNLPVMSIIEVEGLSEVLADKTYAPAEAAAGTSAYMSGVAAP